MDPGFISPSYDADFFKAANECKTNSSKEEFLNSTK